MYALFSKRATFRASFLLFLRIFLQSLANIIASKDAEIYDKHRGPSHDDPRQDTQTQYERFAKWDFSNNFL